MQLHMGLGKLFSETSIKSLITPRGNFRYVDHIVLFCSLFLFYDALVAGKFGFWTDITTHSMFAYEWINDIHIPPHYRTYYISVIVFSGFSPTADGTGPAPAIVLSLFIILRHVITVNIFLSLANSLETISESKRYLICSFASLSTIIAMPLPWKDFGTSSVYLGSVLNNTYHNPTQITSTPFAILTFILYVAYLNSRRDDLVWQICLSSIICAYSKPSFITIFLPLTVFHAILSQIKGGGNKKHHSLFILSSLIPVLFFYLLTYSGANQDQHGIEIGWFEMQRARSWPYPALIIHMTFWLFPLYIASSGDIQIRSLSQNAIFLAIFSVAQTSFLYESGPRFLNANLEWSAKAAWACLMISAWAMIFSNHEENRESRIFVLFLLLLFSFSGAIYVHRIIFGAYVL